MQIDCITHSYACIMVHTFGTELLLMYIPFIQVAKLPSTLLKGPEEVLLTDDSQGMVIMFSS